MFRFDCDIEWFFEEFWSFELKNLAFDVTFRSGIFDNTESYFLCLVIVCKLGLSTKTYLVEEKFYKEGREEYKRLYLVGLKLLLLLPKMTFDIF